MISDVVKFQMLHRHAFRGDWVSKCVTRVKVCFIILVKKNFSGE